MNRLILVLSFIVNLIFSSKIYSQYIPDDFLLKIKESTIYTPISIAKNIYTERYLIANNFKINSNTKNWYYLVIKGQDYYKLLNSEIAKYVYVETSEPIATNDSTRLTHKVNEVHNGTLLPDGFNGKNVVIGIIDSGIDFLHDDFKDSLGKTRIYRYWDQSNKTNTPFSPYNYGFVWTNKDIDNGICSAVDNNGHGTNVAGVASGNGRANGRNKGMAPDAKLVVVETNLSAANWTLTVADACDYIFKVADSLGLPVVINNSNGVQFGSHDGSDPASEKIEALLDEKPGRILVASAGNSGASGKYHIHVDVNTDTSFYWVKPAVNGLAGINTIYVDMWSDSIDFTNVLIGSGANLNSKGYNLRGTSAFRNFNQIYAKSPGAFRDTLYGFSGNKLAYVDYYASIVNHVARVEWVVTSIDSINYFYQFRTTGSGSFDGWSGELNKRSNGKTYTDFITSNLPTTSVLPAMKNYVIADSLQTIFSSYISSEKVITVGNISNRYSYKAKDGNTYYSDFPVGKIFTSSSKGPNRKKIIKPDIAACGNYTLTSSPLYLLNDPSKNNKIDEGGMHSLNGGTSMSAPVITGIAALYLEKCSNATYQDFKDELTKSAATNQHTGNLPNFTYGYGIANALQLLINTNNTFSNSGDSIINCNRPAVTKMEGKNGIHSIIWNDLSTSTSKTFTIPGVYNFKSFDSKKCLSKDSITIKIDTIKPSISIFNKDSKTITCFNDPVKLTVSGAAKYLWNGGLFTDRDSNSISLPGKYKVIGTAKNNCTNTDSIIILKDPSPSIFIINHSNGQFITCNQKTINLSATGANSYSWNRGQNLTGISNQLYDSGMVVLTGIDNKGCIAKDSLLVIVDTLKPNLSLKYIGSKSISCNNDPVVVQAFGASLYEWSGGENLKSAKNSFSLPGKYNVKATNLNGCSSKDSIAINKLNYPEIPTIEFNDSMLISSKSINYQWYKDGIKMQNDTLQKLKIIENGIYMVSVDLNGCISTSSYLKTNLAIEKLDESPYLIYPNPLINNEFKIQNLTSNTTIEIKDITGKNIDFQQIDISHFEITHMVNGIYFVIINDGKLKSTFKILKN